jgi:putative methyltransferase (TIGR04325 family)
MLKQLIIDWTPPAFLKVMRKHFLTFKSITFRDNFDSWEEAKKKCNGYDAEVILHKVLESTLKVKSGAAVYERDSFLFDKVCYSWPVLAALMTVAAKNKGKLDVLDFGGALGSSFFQNKKFLDNVPYLNWSIIEQPNFVEAGIKFIQNDSIKFYKTINACVVKTKPNVILLSSVLQYLEQPQKILKELSELDIDMLIIDRTPFYNDNQASSIKIQYVPEYIYKASYPCWFFSLQDFIANLEQLGFRKVEQFDALDNLSDEVSFLGLIFEKMSKDELSK